MIIFQNVGTEMNLNSMSCQESAYIKFISFWWFLKCEYLNEFGFWALSRISHNENTTVLSIYLKQGEIDIVSLYKIFYTYSII